MTGIRTDKTKTKSRMNKSRAITRDSGGVVLSGNLSKQHADKLSRIQAYIGKTKQNSNRIDAIRFAIDYAEENAID